MDSQPPPKRAKPTTDDDEPKGTVQEEITKSQDSALEKGHDLLKGEGLRKQEKVLSSIERLPNELSWMLIEYATEAVFNLRLASTKLQSKVDDYVRNVMKIPLVSELGFTGSEDKHHAIAPAGLIYVNLFVRKQKAPLFELSLKLRQPPMDFVEEIERETASSSSTAIDDSFKFQLLMDPLFNFHYKSYWDYLMKSLAPRVNFASFFGCNDEEFISICSNLTVPFENMGVVMEQMSDSAMEHLFKITTSSQVEHISLQVGDVTAADPKQALLKLAALVRAIIIIQDPVSSIDADQPYLFGVNDGDWASTIEEMFSKNMSKLYIENKSYREYLTGEAASHLLKILPTPDKKIWFKASFFKDLDHVGSGEVNDHIVEVAFLGAQRGPPMLSIIHSSRLVEPENGDY